MALQVLLSSFDQLASNRLLDEWPRLMSLRRNFAVGGIETIFFLSALFPNRLPVFQSPVRAMPYHQFIESNFVIACLLFFSLSLFFHSNSIKNQRSTKWSILEKCIAATKWQTIRNVRLCLCCFINVRYLANTCVFHWKIHICILPIHICLRFRLRQLWQNIEKKNDDRIECRSVSATGNNNNNSNSVVFNKYHYKFLSSSAALNRVHSMNMRNVNNQTLGDGRRGTLCASHRLSVESFRNIFM